jgi:hypothetical protein
VTHPPKTSGSPVTGMATAPRPADDDACDRADGEHPSASGSVANEMLLSGARNKIDAFMAWGWDYFSKDRATAMVDRTDARRIEWGDDDEGEQPEFDADRSESQSV